MHSPRKNPRWRVFAAGFAAVENQRAGHLRMNAGPAGKGVAGASERNPATAGRVSAAGRGALAIAFVFGPGKRVGCHGHSKSSLVLIQRGAGEAR